MTTEAPPRRRRRSAGPRRRSTRRPGLATAVPQDVLEALKGALRALAEPSASAVTEIHQRFELLEKYDVTLRQTINYAKRVHGGPGGGGQPGGTVESDAPRPPALEAYRRRMNAIGQALSAVFAGMESVDSDLWGRGVYLKLVGRLYEVLDSDELILADLQAISKMVCEQRRAHTQALDVRRRRPADNRKDNGDEDETGSAPPARELPPRFGDVVKRIYGVNLRQVKSASERRPGKDPP